MTAAVLLHSSATSPSMWDGVPEPALEGLTVIKPVNLGYPPHPPLAKGEAFEVAQDVRSALASIPEDAVEVHLAAHSYGGLVALGLLPHLGRRVASICLFEPVLFGALLHSPHVEPGRLTELHTLLDHPWFMRDADRGGSEEWIEGFIDFWNRPGSWARMPEPLKAFTRDVGWKVFQEVSAVTDERLRIEDYVVDVPLTLIKAERSPACARAVVDELARVNPHAQVVDVAGTGHMAPLTHASLFGESIAAHFARVRGAVSA